MALTAAQTLSITLEQVQEDIPLLVESDNTLDRLIQDNGRAQMDSNRAYRIPFETALPGSVAAINLDSSTVALPAGGASEWQNGSLTPVSYAVPIEWTKLAELVTKGPLAITNAVDHQLAQAIRRLKQFRDMMLCSGDGTGVVATITAVAGNVLTLDDTSYGSRLLTKNQFVQIFNGLNLLPSGNGYGNSVQITSIANKLGAAQMITVDTVPAGTAAGNTVVVDGVSSGAPVFLHGIESYLTNATEGYTLGQNRANAPWLLANGVDAGGAQMTLPMLRLPINQIKQSLGEDAVKPGSLVIHTHEAQVAAYEELGEQLTMIPLAGGEAGNLDLLFRGKKTVDGHPIVPNIHAHIGRWDYMVIKAWGKVQYGKPPFWFTQDGIKVFPIYGSNGSPTAGARSFLIDTTDYYCDNFPAQGSIYDCKAPVGYTA
jgi:hypothetical protein